MKKIGNKSGVTEHLLAKSRIADSRRQNEPAQSIGLPLQFEITSDIVGTHIKLHDKIFCEVIDVHHFLPLQRVYLPDDTRPMKLKT